MAKINPKTLKWSAPTTNVDGSPITEALNYTLGVDGVEIASFPGALNADGTYEAQFSGMSIEDGAHTMALKAFYVSSPDLESDWSDSIDVVFGLAAPSAPFGLAAE